MNECRQWRMRNFGWAAGADGHERQVSRSPVVLRHPTCRVSRGDVGRIGWIATLYVGTDGCPTGVSWKSLIKRILLMWP